MTLPLVLKSLEITESSYFNWYRKSIKFAYELLRPPLLQLKELSSLTPRLLFLFQDGKKSRSIWTLPSMTPVKALKLKSIWVRLSSETFFIFNRDFLWKGIWLNMCGKLYVSRLEIHYYYFLIVVKKSDLNCEMWVWLLSVKSYRTYKDYFFSSWSGLRRSTTIFCAYQLTFVKNWIFFAVLFFSLWVEDKLWKKNTNEQKGVGAEACSESI